MIKLMGKLIILLALLVCAFSKPLQGVKGGRRTYDSEVYGNPSRNDDYYNEERDSRLENRQYGSDYYRNRHSYDGQNRVSGGQDIATDEGRYRTGGLVSSNQDRTRSSGSLYNGRSYDDQDVRYRGTDIETDEGRYRTGGLVSSNQDRNRASGSLYNGRSYDDQDVRYRGSQSRDSYSDAEYIGSRGTGYENRRQHGIKH